MGINLFGGGDSHHSNVVDIGEMFDPTSWFLPKAINPHTYAKPVATATNEILSPVFKPINQFHTAITPGKSWLDEKVPLLKAWNDTVENRPADALGIAAATVFGGGALARRLARRHLRLHCTGLAHSKAWRATWASFMTRPAPQKVIMIRPGPFMTWPTRRGSKTWTSR